MVHAVIEKVTQRILRRSQPYRQDYIFRMQQAETQGIRGNRLPCGNFAHGFAGCHDEGDKIAIRNGVAANYGIVTAYNDMLSAHAPYYRYPEFLKETARKLGATAQVAGGTPAMCDGVTQGMPGMELSLFSRDVIAQSTAIALSHQMFDGALYLGICDKIVPGLLMGALSFGHLPAIFVPSGPMPSGLPNKEKAAIRQKYARGEVGDDALLEAEAKSYHSQGTCTFYGTANSNQLLLECMGLQLPGSSFVHPYTPLREAVTAEAVHQLHALTRPESGAPLPLYKQFTEKTLVNAIVGLLASGGSTNHTIHLIAIGRIAGLFTTWKDMDDLSKVVPLLCRLYPNGSADVNDFHRAGGMGFFIRELLSAGLLHGDIPTVFGGKPLADCYHLQPELKDSALHWVPAPAQSLDDDILRPISHPFQHTGGIRRLRGNLGRAVIKSSAVAKEHQRIEAPAVVFSSQQAVQDAYKRGELNKDCVVVVRYQGPKANGMPELHKLMPVLGNLQDAGYKIALVTDGRLSGASGKVPAAIHVSPEALDGGAIAKIQTGDVILLDVESGALSMQTLGHDLSTRPMRPSLKDYQTGVGRELFAGFRQMVTPANRGATTIPVPDPHCYDA